MIALFFMSITFDAMKDAKHIFLNHQAQTTPFPLGIEVKDARGVYINSVDGKQYIDMVSGIAVSNLGHCHPKVVEAVKAQAEQYMHTMVYGEYIQSPQYKFAHLLAQNLPESLDMTYFVNSGTEANEAALKLAKRVTGRTGFVAFNKSYHGSTHGSLSVTGNENKKYAFRPFLPDITFLDFNASEQLEQITDKTAGVIIEVIQGDAGVRIPTQEYLTALRARCYETGAQLIFDEVQTGFGRTGKLFAFEHYNVIPDILTIGKGMGAGMPIGGMISSKEKMLLLTDNPMLGHITTFGGHPVNCAAGYTGLKVLLSEIEMVEIEEKGAYLEQQLQHSIVKEIRRKGLMFAIDLEDFEQVKKVVDYCLENGVLTFWFLSTDYAFRLSPPLNISYQEIDKACKIIQEGFERATAR